MVIPGVTRGGSLMWRIDLKLCLKVVSSEARGETGRRVQNLHAQECLMGPGQRKIIYLFIYYGITVAANIRKKRSTSLSSCVQDISTAAFKGQIGVGRVTLIPKGLKQTAELARRYGFW